MTAETSTRTPSIAPVGGNLPEFTVSELSRAVKRVIEGNFERVRVRGEVSGFKRAASGHLYLALKDEEAVLDAVCWRAMAARLALAPEDGLEVIATGRLTTYPGRSKYQLVIEQLELAGEGALLKLLEERRRKLAAEGLFDAERKQALPFLPEVIGVVTSPTGAVIRDILHRLADRFPRPVLVWPVLVQGEGAAEQIAAAIAGFNALEPGGPVPRPDLLIVARGGGSLEDLWAFNEEVVVRAAAASAIPLISAVGHETDTTLIDFAADYRAPTPTAAAERAVPVRSELLAATLDHGRRLAAAAARLLGERRAEVAGLARGLPEPRRLLEDKTQRLDERAERLRGALRHFAATRRTELARTGAALPHPRRQLDLSRERLGAQGDRLRGLRRRIGERPAEALARLDAARRLGRCRRQILADPRDRLEALGRVLESVSYRKVLARGYAVVRGPAGLIARAAAVTPGLALDIEFADGHVAATASSGPAAKRPARAKAPKKTGRDDPQGSLL
ncbi:MAG TPA: exodeoxyribonuclease VII large subunit [Kiloniellales bacterium]